MKLESPKNLMRCVPDRRITTSTGPCLPAVRRADAVRDALPGASHARWAVQTARRHQTGPRTVKGLERAVEGQDDARDAHGRDGASATLHAGGAASALAGPMVFGLVGQIRQLICQMTK